ncbi:MAG: hypothetical protein N2053_06870 [Chitinispirillaceae bacterium]|nr:hypothetical protein [Chitinispirillaceae bacterium]
MIIRNYLIFFLLFCFCIPKKTVITKEKESEFIFDIEEFAKRCSIAVELSIDDMVAWRTSDSIILQKPFLLDTSDQTWFVDKRGNKRYVFYGRYSYEDGRYYPKYAFVYEEGGEIYRLNNLEVDERTNKIARAVTTGRIFFNRLLDSIELEGVEYNHYIRKLTDSSYSMWFFPAGYGNYTAHGFDFYLSIDSSGSTILSSKIIGQYLRYFELDKKEQIIELNNTYDSIPVVGNLFFALINKDNFKKIIIVNAKSFTHLIYSPDKKELKWVHFSRLNPSSSSFSH